MKSPYALIIECSHHVRNTGLDKVSSYRKMMGAGKPLRFFRDPAYLKTMEFSIDLVLPPVEN